LSIRVVHVISGLGLAGAETVLYRLLAESRGGAVDPVVVSLTHGGPNADRIRALGVPVTALELRSRLTAGDPRPPFELLGLLRRHDPAVVQTWLYHSDVIGGIAARLATRAAVVWNLRHGLAPGDGVRLGRVVRAGVRLSRHVPDRILACAESVRADHAAIGYPAERMQVIPNGIDVDAHRPDDGARARIRGELGIPPDAPLIGRIGRFRDEKDYRLLVEAARRIHARRPDARFLFCGWDVDGENAVLGDWIRDAQLEGVVRLLGRREDVPDLLAALDVLCSSSATEGFPNTIAEAMACGVPCVATDVGDSAGIIGETGRIVPAADADALAGGALELLSLPLAEQRALGRAARRRIETRYSLPAMAARYAELYDELAFDRPARAFATAASDR
jgi:glycosyltransferase involved in cell wall biosynthesis